MNFFKQVLKTLLVKCSSIYILHSDKELIDLYIKSSDECAFEEIFNRYIDKIYSLAFRITRNNHLTEDIVQEIFIILSQKLDTFRGDSSFSTWLYRISTNAALMRLRSEKKHIAQVSVDDNLPYDESGSIRPRFIAKDWANVPDVFFFKKEAIEVLEKTLNELPETYKLVIHLKDVEGFSYIEIADILEISVQAVKSRIHRARLMLRDELSNYFSEWRK